MKDYSKLRNESDIRGIAIEGVPGQEVNLTEQACRDIGRGFALWLIQRSGKTSLRVAVGLKTVRRNAFGMDCGRNVA